MSKKVPNPPPPTKIQGVNMNENIRKHMDLLGRKVTDKVTGFKGIVTSLCFDLYGCIQACVTPQSGKDSKAADSRWFDVSRLTLKGGDPVMTRPDYDYGKVAEGNHGPEDKSTFEHS